MANGDYSAHSGGLAGVLKDVDLLAPAPDLGGVTSALAHILDVPVGEILPVVVGGAPMVIPRLNQLLATREATLLVLFLTSREELESVTQTLANFIGKDRRIGVAMVCSVSKYDGKWFIPAIVSRNPEGLPVKIRDLLSPAAQIIAPGMTAAAHRATARAVAPGSLILDERVMRMARLAVASSSAVMLVGPPGTGKTTFIRELLQEIAHNPAALGLSAPPKEPKWVTPTESWSAFDLLGGQTTNDAGQSRFHLGHLLEAIRQDRWLVLDEANRANMDRIFGPMLTWLSDQRVELGRATNDINSPAIMLDWNDKPQCETVRAELLESERIMVSDPIRFLAGTDWRLLGTYNAQDATRVFGFGNALSRRFSHVPIPPIRPSQFQRALAPRVRDLPPEIGRMIMGLYTAHLRTPKAMLGPAIFLKIADYVRAGVRLPAISNVASNAETDSGKAGTDSGKTGTDSDFSLGKSVSVPDLPTADAASTDGSAAKMIPTDDETMIQLVVEGYLTSAGTWLSQFSQADIDSLGESAIQSCLPREHWDWVRSMLPTMR